MWFCNQCGKENEDKSRFCIYCGSPRAAQQAQPAQPQQPAEQPMYQQPVQPQRPAAQPVYQQSTQPQRSAEQPVYQQPVQPRQPVEQPAYQQPPAEEPRRKRKKEKTRPAPEMDQPAPKKKKGKGVLKVLGILLALLLAAAIGVGGVLLYRQHQADQGESGEPEEPQETEAVMESAAPSPSAEPVEETPEPEEDKPEVSDGTYDRLVADGRDAKMLELSTDAGNAGPKASIMVPSTWLDGRDFSSSLMTWGENNAELVIGDANSGTQLVSFIIDGGDMVQTLLNDGYQSVGVVYTGDGSAMPAYLKIGGVMEDVAISQAETEAVLSFFERSIMSSFRWLEPLEPQADSQDFLLPDSSTAYVTTGQLDQLTHEELCFARNEIFARHGRIFTTPELRDYFEGKDWYTGTVSGAQFDTNVFNDFERANIKFITDYEDWNYGGSYY